jgi:hypothetical protein
MKYVLMTGLLMMVLLSGCIAGPTPHPGDDTGKFNGLNTSDQEGADAGSVPMCDENDPACPRECGLVGDSVDGLDTTSDALDGDGGDEDGETAGDGDDGGPTDNGLEEIAADQ